MRCVTFVSFSFLVNDSVCGYLKPSRGLRQGDLLSPYLFLICVEGLSQLIIKTKMSGDIAGFRKANERVVNDVSRIRRFSTVWHPPCDGFYKVNLDAALDMTNEVVGISIIARNAQGQFASEVGLWPCIFETDALSVVNLINDHIVPCSEIGLILRDILVLLESFPSFSIGFVPRNGNMAAHRLAKFVLGVESSGLWLEDCPLVWPRLWQVRFRI
ncbi:hypothetical protein Ddye_012220 [Dipteronia dyeriana]|uniref:RNase H type-1 domain-containing protein n=1 Tax=Dipteronia dyeriana TaxID=168575 RepID=A0AAD9X423_9ROSI|nr:hypothetical protein Ddye_012220 [Dipteronia dyeriana]